MDGRRTVVVAGSHREFVSWCQDHDVSPYSPDVIDASVSNVRGLRDVQVAYTGTWRYRRDLAELGNALRFIEFFSANVT